MTIQHSKFSPSSAKRWIQCPGSLNFSNDSIVESEAAKRGSLIHALAASALSVYAENEPEIDQDFISSANEGDLEVAQSFADIVLQYKKVSSRLFVEQTIDISYVNEECFGTPDAVILDRESRTVFIFDLKTGFLNVEAKNNYQLMLYACAFLDHDYAENFFLAIHQPATYKFESVTLSKSEIRDFADTAKRAANSAHNQFTAGKDQCEYCVGKISCKYFTDYVNDLIDIENVENIEDEILKSGLDHKINVLKNKKLIENYIKNIENELKESILKGKKISGVTLKEIKGRRSLSEQGLISLLNDYPEDTILTKNPKKLTDIEKSIGKKLDGPFIKRSETTHRISFESD